MKKRVSVKTGPWDIAAAVLSVLLLANFLGFLIVCLAAFGLAFDPAELMVTGVFLFLGIAFLPLAKRKCVSRLWKRLLWAGLIGNGLIVLFICVVFAVMLSVWQ